MAEPYYDPILGITDPYHYCYGNGRMQCETCQRLIPKDNERRVWVFRYPQADSSGCVNYISKFKRKYTKRK